MSKKFFDCWDPRRRVTGRVENTQKGIEGFLPLLGEEDALVVDPAGGYEKRLMRAAAEKGIPVYVGSSYATSKLSKMFHRGKTDPLEARNMSLRGEKGLLRENQPYAQDQKAWAIEDLMEEYKQADNSATLNRNYTVKHLDEILPGIHILGTGPAALKFYLRYLTPQGIKKLQSGGLEEVRKALRECHWKLAEKAEEVWETLSRYEEEEGVAEFKLRMMRTYAQRLLQDLKTKKEIEAQLKEILETIEGVEKALQIPGVGLMTMASVVAAAGNVEKFKTWRDFERFLGMDVVPRQSGKYRGKGRLSKRGNSTARKYLYLAALAAIRQVGGAFREYYLKKVGKGKMIAVVAVMRKLLRIVYTVWKNSVDYEPNLVGTGAAAVTAPAQ